MPHRCGSPVLAGLVNVSRQFGSITLHHEPECTRRSNVQPHPPTSTKSTTKCRWVSLDVYLRIPDRYWPYSGAVDGVGSRPEPTPEPPGCGKHPDTLPAFGCSNESIHRRRLLSRFQNPGLQGNDLFRDNLATMSGIQTGQAFFNKTLFPPSNEHLAAAFLFHNGSIRLSGRQPKNHLRTPHFSCFHRSGGCHSFQFPPLMRRQSQPSC